MLKFQIYYSQNFNKSLQKKKLKLRLQENKIEVVKEVKEVEEVEIVSKIKFNLFKILQLSV